jgi:acetate kinase
MAVQRPSVLVVNCGSSSLKLDLIEPETGATRARGLVERIGAVTALGRLAVGDAKGERFPLDAPDHTHALEALLRRVREHPALADAAVGAVGHRVVHGGERFTESVVIDEEVTEAIREAFDLAPLHNPANLKGIEAARAAFPDVAHVAVFDTAFHQTLPPEAYLYALPIRLYRRYKVRRYGFHGTSHRYVSRRLVEAAGLDPHNHRVVTLHLGNGCSACAVRGGRSVDTSMGMTPTGGLVMGTRCGDLDPGVVFELVEKEELTLAEVHTQLNRFSGLLGLSGYAADMRDLLAEAAGGDVRCQQAVDVFCYRAKQYLGMYFATLGGCDAVAFTAGIGEHSPEVRAGICAGLEGLGVVLDDAANRAAVGVERRISADRSPVQVWVVPTNEELVIARDAARLARSPAAGR